MSKTKAAAMKGPAQKQESPPPAMDLALFVPEDTEGFYDGTDGNAYAKPFLGILQALSPAVQRGKAEYIDGAQPGMILNTVTKKLSDEVHVSVLNRTHTFTYWIVREEGGGLVREEPVTIEGMNSFMKIPQDDKGRRLIKESQNGKTVTIDVLECRNFFCHLFDPDEPQAGEIAIVSMNKSQLSVAREWNSLIAVKSQRLKDENGNVIRGLPPVLQSGVWKLSTVMKTKGENSWYKWAVSFQGLHTSKEVVATVKENTLLARAQTQIDRQLEHIIEPEGGTAEM
jgi:hypothetical protein